ncbi:TPM domain-containing protein [Rhodoferax sp. PAMC 29310]|uniref:TPM domain-containing protein n=1 Tax=Rhodoferax sp. PAMC 29310 TaxID=2822760 RepID=UPI001B33F540|nr:TPM domain-containing protein [Rhodoferax sp. PAMC 29310]
MVRLKRFFKHRWVNEATTRQVLPSELLHRLEQRIGASERRHSGEIRIYVETLLPLQYLYRNAPTSELVRDRALEIFSNLRVWDTANNNGVLIYLLAVEHSIEVVADRGLNSWLNAGTWSRLVTNMSGAFRRGDYEGGLTHALEEVSAVLMQHFPLSAGERNPNELPDAPIVN